MVLNNRLLLGFGVSYTITAPMDMFILSPKQYIDTHCLSATFIVPGVSCIEESLKPELISTVTDVFQHWVFYVCEIGCMWVWQMYWSPIVESCANTRGKLRKLKPDKWQCASSLNSISRCLLFVIPITWVITVYSFCTCIHPVFFWKINIGESNRETVFFSYKLSNQSLFIPNFPRHESILIV